MSQRRLVLRYRPVRLPMKSLSCSLALLLPALALGQNRSQELHESRIRNAPGPRRVQPILALERRRRGFENYLSRLRQVSLSGLPGNGGELYDLSNA
jgi:hypothetical protein